MELEGRFNPTLSLPDVLQFLSMGKMTGTLTVVHGSYSVSLMVRGGKLVNSTSLDRPRRLGMMLLNRGFIQRNALEDALQYQSRQKPPPLLGQLLIEREVITPDQLRQAIRLQLEEEMWDLFSLEEGSFKFEHGDEGSVGNVVVELEIGPLIIEGSRRLDEWARIVRNIPTDTAVPSIVAAASQADREEMQYSDSEWRVLSLVNGYYNVGSLCHRSGVGRFETYRILNSFLASGVIRIRLDSAERPLTQGSSSATPRTPLPAAAPREVAPKEQKQHTGTSSARLMALFQRRKPVDESGSTPGVEAASPPPQLPRLKFNSPVAFVVGLSNGILEQLLNAQDFYLGPSDDYLAETHWGNILMMYPRADLITAKGNEMSSRRFDRYLEVTGLGGPLRACYDEAMEALARFLKVLFLLASQRIGVRSSHMLFAQFFADFRMRSNISNAEDFYFQEFGEKVYA
jgi:hypothetical protein